MTSLGLTFLGDQPWIFGLSLTESLILEHESLRQTGGHLGTWPYKDHKFLCSQAVVS